MNRVIYVISVLVLINVLSPTEAITNNFNGTIWDNIRDALQIFSNYGSASSFIPTYKENHELGILRFLLAFYRKKPDEARTCGQFIKSRGYDSEQFNVTTIDGYILSGYRIINQKFRNIPKPKPFLLLPATFTSCGAFLSDTESRNGSIAYYLADRGEDVFIILPRGSTYSRKHVHLNSNLNPNYYDFDLEDVGTKDVPATVEYMKKITGHNQIRLLAFSFATTEILIQLSLDPSYSKNYELIFLEAPIGYLGHVKGTFGVIPRDPLTIRLLSTIRAPAPPFLPFINAAGVALFCTYTAMEPLCLEAFNTLFGPDTYEQDVSRLAVHVTLVDTTSNKLFAHILQSINFDHVRRFDHGKRKNLKKYGSVKPPIYNYNVIPTDNIISISAVNDNIANPEDVQKLRNSFSTRPCVDHIITFAQWNHLDFLIARDTNPFLNDVVYDITQKYANNPSCSNLQQYNNVDSYTYTSASASASASSQS